MGAFSARCLEDAVPALAEPIDLADDAAEIDRGAFNAAFYELGLPWFWDGDTYRTLCVAASPRERVRGFLQAEQAHLLRAYDADALTDTILAAYERCRRSLANRPAREMPRCNWSDTRWGETGV